LIGVYSIELFLYKILVMSFPRRRESTPVNKMDACLRRHDNKGELLIGNNSIQGDWFNLEERTNLPFKEVL